MEDLRNLPLGAVYGDKSGQATATVQADGDTIIVMATCDSLQNLVFAYEKEITRIRNDTENYKKETEKTGIMTALKWCLTGILIGVIISISMKRIINKWQKKK